VQRLFGAAVHRQRRQQFDTGFQHGVERQFDARVGFERTHEIVRPEE
jgi:hypothetical protein